MSDDEHTDAPQAEAAHYAEEQADYQARRDAFHEARKIRDENGISAEMLDTMQAAFAEGLTTGETDLRSLLYCAHRPCGALVHL